MLNVLSITLTVISSVSNATKSEGVVEINPVEYHVTREWQHLCRFIQLLAWGYWKEGNLQHNLQKFLSK